MNPSLEFSRNLAQAYNMLCKPLCQEWNLPQTALDILMFLANNPDRRTARDVVELRHIKANLVSVNVERLVQEGYLTRTDAPEDRRKVLLAVTEQAQPLIRRGRKVQESFFEQLFEGVSPEARGVFTEIIDRMGENLERILEGAN